MDCKKIHSLLPDYLCGALGPAEAQEIRRHVESCPSCNAELKAHEETWRLVAEVPDISPSPGFTAAVLKRLKREPAARRVQRRPITRPAFIRVAAAVAACLLVGIIGIAVWQPWRGAEQKPPERRTPPDRVTPVAGKELTDAEEAEIISNLDLLANLDSLSMSQLKPDDIDVLKQEDYPKSEELARRGIEVDNVILNSNGKNEAP